MATTIEQLYRDILGREPEAEGLAYWKNAFGSSVDAIEQASFMQAAQAELARRTPAEQAVLAPKLVNQSASVTAPVIKAVAPTESVAVTPTMSLKDQLLQQWSALGIKELPGGISLADRATGLADVMKQNGIVNIADLKLGSKTISVDEEGGTAPVGYLTNKGQQLGFLGNVNENLKGKAEYLQPDNLMSWTSEGKGNVGYTAIQTADGGVAIVPQWNSSSDMKQIRDAAKLIATVYGVSALASGGLFAGTSGAASALDAGMGVYGAGASGTGLLSTAGGIAAGGGVAAGEGASLATLAGGGGLSAAEYAALYGTDLASTGLLAGGADLYADLANVSNGTGASLSTLAGGGGLTAAEYAALYGTGGLTAAQIAALSGSLTAGSTLTGGLTGGLTSGLTSGLTTGLTNTAITTGLNSILGGGTSNIGNLFNTGLTTAGGLLQQQTSKEAAQKAQAMIDAETAAAKQAAQFRPVGMTTRFGTSQFGYDPKTGQMTSAGYTLSPEAKAQQDRFVALSNAGLTQAEGAQAQFAPLQTGATSLFALGNKYIAQTPEDVAKNYLTQQMALLQPGREQELATLQNRLQQQGRGGLAVAQGGTMGATTPELQALYNARAQQEAQLAANAQQAGQQQVLYGAGLLGQGTTAMGNYYAGQQAAYAPYTTAQGQVQNLETLGQQPFNMSTAFAGQTSTAGARAGQLGLEGAKLSTALATGQAATTNPYATLLGGLGGSNPFGQVLGNAANSLLAGGGLIDQALYPSGNPLQTGIYADPGLWT